MAPHSDALLQAELARPLPYGLADFPRLITDGYVYVDRTAHIRTLEELALLFLLRPWR